MPELVANQPIIGQATVIDGDTIEVRGQRIRVVGTVAFEARQLRRIPTAVDTDAGSAAFALADPVGRRNLTCEPSGSSWDRIVVLYISRAARIWGAWMVSQGWAVDDGQYRPDYLELEAEARGSKARVRADSRSRPAAVQ